MDPEGVVGQDPALGKSQVAIYVLRNTDTPPPPLRSNWSPRVQLLIEGGSYGYINKKIPDEISVSAHVDKPVFCLS